MAAGRVLEIRSTQQGTPSVFSADRMSPADPYHGKRVRFRAYLKTEAVAEDGLLCRSHRLGTSPTSFANTEEPGVEGHDRLAVRTRSVVDVPADAEGLSIAVVLRGVRQRRRR